MRIVLSVLFFILFQGHIAMALPNSFGASINIDGRTFLFGGYSPAGQHSDVHEVESCGQIIRDITPSKVFSPRSFVPIIATETGRAWLFGGYQDNPPSNVAGDVWSFYPGQGFTHVAVDAQWEQREAQAVVYHGGWLYLYGGVTYFAPERSPDLGGANPSHLRTFGDVWKSGNGFDWELVNASAPWGPRRSFGYASFGGYMWVYGGVNDETATVYNDVWRSGDGVTWELVTENAPWAARAITNPAPVFDGAMWVVGGDSLEAPPNTNWHKTRISKGLGDVWKSTDGVNWTNVGSIGPRTGALVFEMICTGVPKLGVFGGYDDLMVNGVRTRSWYNDLWTSPTGAAWSPVTYTYIPKP